MQHTGERSGIGRPAAHRLRIVCSRALLALLACLCAMLTSCRRTPQTAQAPAAPAILHVLDLTSPTDPALVEGPAILSGARNETLDLIVQADADALAKHRWLHVTAA